MLLKQQKLYINMMKSLNINLNQEFEH